VSALKNACHETSFVSKCKRGLNLKGVQLIALISCSKLKSDKRCKAFQMYWPSQLFRKSYFYCINKGYRIYILSAKHVLLRPEDEIDPYDNSIFEMSKRQKDIWAESVIEKLTLLAGEDNENLFNEIQVFAGKEYLRIGDNNKGLIFKNVMEGLQIGERLRFLSGDK
jgi:hypothetical protein